MKTENDILHKWFERLPEEELPAGFRQLMMQKIEQEYVRRKKRDAQLNLIGLIFGIVLIITSSALAIWLSNPVIPALEWPEYSYSFSFSRFAISPFYLFIAAIVLLLLYMDRIMRLKYRKKHDRDVS